MKKILILLAAAMLAKNIPCHILGKNWEQFNTCFEVNNKRYGTAKVILLPEFPITIKEVEEHENQLRRP